MAGAAKKLIPLLDRVLVEKVAAKTKSVGGILLPESAASKAREPPSSAPRAPPETRGERRGEAALGAHPHPVPPAR